MDSTSGRGVNHFLAQGYNPKSWGHARPLCRVELGGKLTGGRCRVVVDAELGADPVAVGVVDLIEDPQGLGPGPAGR